MIAPGTPDPVATLEEFARFHHEDLATFTGRELWLEQERVRLALVQTSTRTDTTWLWQRLGEVRRERARRRRGTAS